VANMERARDVRKFCLRTQTGEGKIREHYSGIDIHKFCECELTVESVQLHTAIETENVPTVYSISAIKLKSKSVHYAEKAPVGNQ